MWERFGELQGLDILMYVLSLKLRQSEDASELELPTDFSDFMSMYPFTLLSEISF